jgi:multiple sugar transport system permease protein
MQTRSPLRQLLTASIFLLPGLVLFVLFFAWPMVYSFRISFFDWKIARPQLSTFIGLGNYLRAISDPIFHRAVINTVSFTAITVSVKMVLGLGVALLLNEKLRGRGLFRLTYYFPVITSIVIVSLLFQFLFSGQGGLVNYFLKDVLHVIDRNILWLANPVLVMVPINVLDIWKGVGWAAIIYLAGLQSIPAELYEAAAVDGAGPWSNFKHVTLPLLRPSTTFLIVVLIIGGLNAYIPFLLITNAGGRTQSELTHSVLTLMQKTAIRDLEFGYSAAISYLLTIGVFAISVVELRLLRQRRQD